MRRRLLLAGAAALVATQALAGFYAPSGAPDLAGYAKRTDMPGPCGTIPAPDTLLGSPGSSTCYTPNDATRPTVVQAANVVTDSSGNWSVTWARPFASAMPIVNPLPVNTGSLPILCNVVTRSASSASGKCWQSTANTLPSALASLAGMVINPFGTMAASAGVMIIGREPTQ